VVALCEPVELWVRDPETEKNYRILDDLAVRLNEQMPEGFRVIKCLSPAESAPALGKACAAAHYWIWARGIRPISIRPMSVHSESVHSESVRSIRDLLDHLRKHFGKDVLFAEAQDGERDGDEGEEAARVTQVTQNPRISVVLANPAKNGIGGWVKALTHTGILDDGEDTAAPVEGAGVAGWKDLGIVRTALGCWDGSRMKTLAEEGAAWD
jgi:hypothetical protein